MNSILYYDKLTLQIISLQKQELALFILNVLFARRITAIAQISQEIDKTYNTTNSIISKFIGLEIIAQTDETENKRYKQYRFHPYLELLEKEY